MPKFRQNYFVGFKLPWTLENVDNWNETHKVAGKIWVYGGLFQAVSTFVLSMKLGFICFMLATAVMVIIPFTCVLLLTHLEQPFFKFTMFNIISIYSWCVLSHMLIHNRLYDNMHVNIYIFFISNLIQ